MAIVVVLSSKTDGLQHIEQIIRKEYGQKTITTFETIEMKNSKKNKQVNETEVLPNQSFPGKSIF